MSPVYEEYFDILTEDGALSKIQDEITAAVGDVFRFEEFLWDVLSGEIKLDLNMILDLLSDVAFSGLSSSTSQIMRIMGIALLAAVFTNFAFSFRDGNVSATAFYVCYLILYGILVATFYEAYEITYDAVSHITGFMKVLVPSYCIAIAFAGETVTAMCWYESILLLISLSEYLLLKIILPLISTYMTVNLAGNLSNENILSKLCEMIEMAVGWCLKGIITLIIGLSGVQGILSGTIDRVKRTALMKSVEFIPGIGSVIDGVNETVLAAGVLLKDAFGVGGMIAIAVISMVPLVRLAVYAFVYKAEAALIQPVSDRRIISCINAASKASLMMLRAVFTSGVLFVIAIVIVLYTG